VTFQEPGSYSPPTGFESASVKGTPKSSQLFKESNLQGKQIWYITAPASAPLSSIEELSLLDIKEHRKVLSHKGDDYGFIEDESEATAITKVLVPSSSDDGYRSGRQTYINTSFTPLRLVAKTPVTKILHLQQIVQPPSLPQITTPAKKPVRQQPRGLKMRFRPIGFSNGDMGRIGSSSSSEGESSDQEMQDAPPAKFRKPESLSAAESSDSSEDDDSSSHAEKTKAPPKPSKSKAPAVGSSKTTDGSLKRKSSEGGDKKSKHSSSRPTNVTDDRRLKRIKREQIKIQKTINSQSVPTEARNTDSMMLPPRARTSLTPIPPPTSKIANSKASIVPPSHILNRITPIPPPISTQISSQSSHVSLIPSNPRTAVSEATSKDYSHLDEQIRAIDPSLTRKERRNETKRLKRSESSYDSKDKRRESVPSSADMAVGPVKNTSISPPPSSKPVSSSPTSSKPKEKKEKEDKDKKKEEKKARKEKKLRRKEGKMANEVLDKGNETPNFSPPHSTSATLPPRHMSKR
jgi:hypothetical protein